jgi:hypothetical protein
MYNKKTQGPAEFCGAFFTVAGCLTLLYSAAPLLLPLHLERAFFSKIRGLSQRL